MRVEPNQISVVGEWKGSGPEGEVCPAEGSVSGRTKGTEHHMMNCVELAPKVFTHGTADPTDPHTGPAPQPPLASLTHLLSMSLSSPVLISASTLQRAAVLRGCVEILRLPDFVWIIGQKLSVVTIG